MLLATLQAARLVYKTMSYILSGGKMLEKNIIVEPTVDSEE